MADLTMDGETVRAFIAAVLWQAGTSLQRETHPPAWWLEQANQLLLASYELGAPLSPETVLIIRPDQWSADRFRDWYTNQPEDVRTWFRAAIS